MGRLRRVLTVGLAALLAAATALPDAALAEPVECPACWRVVEDGPCQCPHCGAALPGRECPAAPSPEPAPAAPEPARVEQGRGDDRPSRPRRRRRRPRPRPDRDRPAGEAGPPAARSGEDRSAEGEAPRRRRRRRPPATAPASPPPTAPAAPEAEVREGSPDQERPRRRRRRRRPRPEAERPEAQVAPNPPRGPAFLAGYRYFGLYDWTGQGHTHALSVEGFPLARVVPWLRVGLGADLGFRLLDGHTDWTFRGFASLGAQYPWRVTPYGSLNIGGGMAYRQRFGQGLVDGLFAVGFDAGITWPATRTFVLDLGLGYLYMGFAGLDFHSFTIRVALGW